MSRADDDDYDDRPRRRRRDDDDYEDDDRPRRAKAGGGGTTVWVIIGLVVGVMFCCAVPVGIGLLLPAVQKVREAAGRAKDTNNFKQVALGAHAYHDVNGPFPPADGPVSWRVHILPHVEQEALFRRFDVKQPWDGPENRPLAAERVATYLSPLDGPAAVETRIRVFVGPDTMFPPGKKPQVAEVTDGISNTIFAAESADTVPWPSPRELPYTRSGPVPKLGHPDRPTGFLVAMGDGSVKFVRSTVSEATIRSGITARADDGRPNFD
jgi:hypothetical protein